MLSRDLRSLLPLRDKEITRRSLRLSSSICLKDVTGIIVKEKKEKKMYSSYVNLIELPLIICNQNKGSNRRKNSISVQLVASG